MESIVILIFVIMLVGCIFTGLPVITALIGGFVLFFTYGILTGHGARRMWKKAVSGIYTIRTILEIFLMIGMLTALWREAGTIPAITYYASAFVRPGIMILMCFLLNCMISFLTGSSFASTATMGVITMTMANMAGIPAWIAGGAILSGVYFGDRSAPVSTSALLVATLTKTDIFDNIRGCMKTAALPFVISCAVYGILGAVTCTGTSIDLSIRELFAEEFRIGILPLLPAVLILVLAMFRVRVIKAMAISIAAAFLISIFYQHAALSSVLPGLVFGYQAKLPELDRMISGGGIRSMFGAAAIVSVSSCYAGMFEETGLLAGLKAKIRTFSDHTVPFAGILVTAIVTCAVSCNQTLSVMLTDQLCRDLVPDHRRFAIQLENSVAVTAALIPWNIACAVPLATLGAPAAAILFACYLWMLPLAELVRSFRKKQTDL